MRALLLVRAQLRKHCFTDAAGLLYGSNLAKIFEPFAGQRHIAAAVILEVFLGELSLDYFLCGKISVYV